MARLEFTFKNDTLFKMLFVKYPELLKRLVSELLSIQYESIEQFEIRNPEIPAELLGGKYCRLDILMTVNGQQVNLEIQVKDRKDFPERSLYYWARSFSTAIAEGDEFKELPRTISINILAFSQFDCAEFHSEFQALEVSRHTPLTDRFSMHYFELPKLPAVDNANDTLKLWLALFKAETEEDLARIKEMGGPIMEQAIDAYTNISESDRLREIERMRHKANFDYASDLYYARQEGAEEEKIEIARNAFAEGLSFDTIRKITGLDSETLSKIQASI